MLRLLVSLERLFVPSSVPSCLENDETRKVLLEATLSAFVPSFRPFRPKNKLSLKGENDIKR